MNIRERLTVTVPEAAQVLGIGRGLAYELARQGKLPILRLGRRLLVPRVALDRLLAGDPAAPSSHLLEPVRQEPGPGPARPAQEKGSKP